MRRYTSCSKIMLKIMKQQKGTKLGCMINLVPMSKILVPRHTSITRAKHNKNFKKNINDPKQGGLMGRKETNKMTQTQTNHMYPQHIHRRYTIPTLYM
jgi:hypothetical protein